MHPHHFVHYWRDSVDKHQQPQPVFITATDHGLWVSVVASVLLAWTLCFYSARVYIRIRYTPWGHDDTAITVGTALAVVQVAAICQSVHYGFGTKQALLNADQLEMVEKTLFASQVLYIAALGASRCSTAFLINRLTRASSHRVASNAVIIFTTVWAVVAILVISLRGDLTHPWRAWDQPHSGLFPRWIVIEVIGMLIEIAIVVCSVTLVCFLQMSVSLKTMVVGAFAIRTFVIVPSAIRLYYISPDFNRSDPTFLNVYAAMLTQVAMHFNLIVASFPCLKPFIRPFDTGYVGTTVIRQPQQPPASGRRRSTYARSDLGLTPQVSSSYPHSKAYSLKDQLVSALGSSASRQSRRGTVTDTSWSATPMSLRPDAGEFVTMIEHSPHPAMGVLEMGGDEMVIRQTKECEVQVEVGEERGDVADKA